MRTCYNTTCLIIFSGDVSKDDNSSSTKDSHWLTPLAIAGIVIGSLVVVVVVVIVAALIKQCWKNRVQVHPPPVNPNFGRSRPLTREF